MVRNFTALTYCLSLGVFMMTTVSANAATFTLSDPAARRGAPIAQNFLEMHGDNVSLLGTPNGLSCVASQPLRISESVYLAPDGTEVPFSEVTRVIPPFLMGCSGRTHAAAFSFMAGVIPPMPMLGRSLL